MFTIIEFQHSLHQELASCIYCEKYACACTWIIKL